MATAAGLTAAGGSPNYCRHGSSFGDVATFWNPDWAPAHASQPVGHRATPYVTPQHGFEVQLGEVGLNEWANTSIHSHLDQLGVP
jgi:hypothetical protein